MEWFNEFCFFLNSLHLYLFTDMVTDIELTFLLGYSVIMLVTFNIGFNLMLVITETFIDAKENWKKK